MSKIYANPFCWGRPVSGNHYIARPGEQSQIADTIEKQLNLIISGRRGSGKTSLVKQTLEKNKNASVYLDLSFVVSREHLTDLLLDALEKHFPAVEQTGQSKALRSGNTGNTLGPVIELWYSTVKHSNNKFTIVWDGFQHLIKLKDHIISDLGKLIYDRREITHIMISHREDILQDIFADSVKPFFKSCDFLYLDTLDAASFSRFLTQRFRRMGLSDFDLADAILKFTAGYPQLTQKFAHTLAQLWLEGSTTRLKDRALKKLLENQDTVFSGWWDNFGLNEKRLLLGLASGQTHPTELGFIRKYKLSATSTAHNTVLKLIREGWLINRDEGYHIYDPLFLKWLQAGKGLS